MILSVVAGQYAERRGWRVFPILGWDDGGQCDCRNPCASVGKHPAVRAWQRVASNEPPVVRELFNTHHRGIGVATGEGSGVWVLDLDTKNGVDGIASVEHLDLPPTHTVRTPSGGLHMYWRWSEGVRNRAAILPGVDVRGAGGYVVAAESETPQGEYTVSDARAPVDAPQELLDLVLRRKEAPVSVPSAARTDRYALTALDNAANRVAGTGAGGRNNELNTSAYSIGRLVAAGRVGATAARETLIEAGRACGLDEHEARKTVTGAFGAAESDPHYPDPLPVRVVGNAAPAVNPANLPGPDVLTFSGVASYSGLGSQCFPPAADLHLAVNPSNGRPTQNAHNYREIMRDPRFGFWSCQMHRRDMWGDEEVSDRHASALSAWIAAAYGVKMGRDLVREYLALAASMRPRDRLAEYLRGLKWDGRIRVPALLTDLFGVAASPLAESYATRWAVGCVARALDPGCKLDTALVLVGQQGAGKSSTLRALVGDEWFRDSDLDLDTKDGYLGLQGVWVYELAEMAGVRRAQMAKVKALLSSSEDVYRPPYGRDLVKQKRRAVLVGTENHDGFLADSSGSRRWWPVKAGRCDPQLAAQVRDQVWAEAVVMFEAGAQWWLAENEDERRVTESVAYSIEDPWTGPILEWIDIKHHITTVDVLDLAVKVPREKQTPRDGHRVADILRRAGWARVFVSEDGKRKRKWARA